MKKFLSLVAASALILSMAGCASSAAPSASPSAAPSDAPAESTAPADSASPAPSADAATADKGTIYYLNFKPEIAPVYDKIAAEYKAETGVTLKVVTAASGTYEQTLTSEVAKSDPPVIFQINGPRGYATWKDYCADLTNTDLYKHLSDKTLAISNGNGVYGVPYVVEGYGIIYNDAIMKKYFALPDKAVSISSTADIKSFDILKQVADDMQAKKDKLGIQGAFAATSLSPGEDWRWQTHLANLPVFYEFRDNKVDLASDATKTIKFQYSDNFKNIFDLYTTDSTTKKGLLGGKSVDDSMAEFALGKAAMVQNGNWAWSQISGVQGNTVKPEDVKFMPIYTGMQGEENQGLCIGTENFFAINNKVSPEQQKLAADFLYWLYSSDKGKSFVTNDLKFIAPFDTFGASDKPTDPLALEISNWMSKPGVYSVPWNFTVFPNQTFKDDFGAALLQYVQGAKQWDDVKSLFVTEWAKESAQ